MKTHPLFRAVLAIVALVGGAGTAMAAQPPATQCGVTGTGTVSTGVYYNPFDPNPLSQVAVPLTLTRNASGAQKTQQVYFVIVKPDGSPNYQISARAPGGTTYTSVAYYASAVPSNLPTISSNTPGQVAYNFGGASQPDTVTFDLLVTVPAGTDLSAGKPISLGIRYVCTGTGGMSDITTPTDQTNAVLIDVHVLSGLQAYYAGSMLDFGEIGTISTATVQASPATYRTPATNRFAVKSSGGYNVKLSSANAFQLKNGGSGTANQIAYSLKFLGQTLTTASGGAGTPVVNKDCAAVGITNYANLPIQATLLEGGQGKNPSPSYTDTLTITLTPKAASFTGGDTCQNYTVP